MNSDVQMSTPGGNISYSSGNAGNSSHDDDRGATIVSPIIMCMAGVMPGGEHLCEFNGLVMVCFGLSTPLIVGFMALERFLFVKHTFFYTKHCVPGAARGIVFALWGFVLFFGLLPLVGFGEYVSQHPGTWCFLNFRTSDPVHSAYGYIYSCLTLLLVLIMVACNLVVIVTLAKVREFRRKHSTGSLNSVLVGEGALDETAKQQAMARKRTQKDIELQMIVVVCAITAVFAICWVPLMIHILLSLILGGKGDPKFALMAIRLASVNQILNPWLYVILRRTLIIRVKKVFCRWKRLLRKKTRPRPRTAPPVGGRRHQYVHVRNQLCHRNMFVGELEPDSLSLTDSMRKSLQRAIPAAMSLPDVMMLDTGRYGEQLPLPDIAKAQSFGGRVSHTDSHVFDVTDYPQGDSHTHCPYCRETMYPSPGPFVSDSDCSECVREREALALKEEQRKLKIKEASPLAGKENGITETHKNLREKIEIANGELKPDALLCETHQVKRNNTLMHPPSEIVDSLEIAKDRASRCPSLCLKHAAEEASRSSLKGHCARSDIKGKEHESRASRPSSLKHDLERSHNLSKSSSSKSTDGSHPQGPRRLLGDSSRTSSSMKSSSASSSVKAKLPLHQSNSLDVPTRGTRPISPIDFQSTRVKSYAGPSQVMSDNQRSDDEGDKDDDNDDMCNSFDADNTMNFQSTLRTDTTTDDYGFSSMPSMPTESVLLSEPNQNTKNVSKRTMKESPKSRPFLKRFGGNINTGSVKNSGVLSGLPPRASKPGNAADMPGVAKTVKPISQTDQQPSERQGRSNSEKTNRSKFLGFGSVKKAEPSTSQLAKSNATTGTPSSLSPDASPSAMSKRSEATSGIVSDESPRISDHGSKGKCQKDMLSEPEPAANTKDKAIVRKVKSLN
ncbi:prostaglandin e2 receptor ep4 subtype [Plakobranchus ocellatus]|uniref:Prostaglandin e2 receptor ep4 subtype n=1 Tax=Plakobranchus ocellatus TaxID=259542 RepID=A0AAV3YA86_9GAST|nr:prostaglandin e2 receptor ep4 subtype [Plakobranchus ocellatus]